MRQNVCSAFLPLKGLFWTGVGGVQVVNLAAKATGPAARLGGGGVCRLIRGTSSRCCFWCVLVYWQRLQGAEPCLIPPSGLGAALAGTHTRRQRHWSTSEGSVVPPSRTLNHIFIISESAPCRRLCSDTHDSAALVFGRRRNNELLSHPLHDGAERILFDCPGLQMRRGQAERPSLRFLPDFCRKRLPPPSRR